MPGKGAEVHHIQAPPVEMAPSLMRGTLGSSLDGSSAEALKGYIDQFEQR